MYNPFLKTHEIKYNLKKNTNALELLNTQIDLPEVSNYYVMYQKFILSLFIIRITNLHHLAYHKTFKINLF